MATQLHLLADELGVHERTLRRAVRLGLVRGSGSPGPNYVMLARAETAYLRIMWPQLQALRERARVERRLTLVVLFGPMARDVDPDPGEPARFLLQSNGHSGAIAERRFREYAGRLTRRRVVVREEPRDDEELLEVVDYGRVICDRSSSWMRLRRERAPAALRVMPPRLTTPRAAARA